MSAFEKDWLGGDLPESLPFVGGLTIDELNRYLPALQQADDLKNKQDELKEGLYQVDVLTGLKELPGKSVDLVVTKPPENPVRDLKESGIDTTWQDLYAWHQRWLKECRRVLKDSGFIILFCNWPQSGMYQSLVADDFYIRTRITWRKPANPEAQDKPFLSDQCGDLWVGTVERSTSPRTGENAPGSNFWSDVVDWAMNRATDHRLIPEQVMERILKLSTTKLDWVVDPFMGSGQTGVAAKKMGRRFIGFDQDQDRCLLAMKRIDQA